MGLLEPLIDTVKYDSSQAILDYVFYKLHFVIPPFREPLEDIRHP